ncbi:hypothetical protein SKB0092_43520 (plasmid) [Roseomonas mucosa]
MPDALSESSLIIAEDAACVQNEHGAQAPAVAVSGARILSWLMTLGWTERELARRTGCHQTTVRRWINGATPMDAEVAAWLGMLAAFLAAHPGPRALSRARSDLAR